MARKFLVTQKAVLFSEGEVLLVRDAKDRDWEFPGGKVDRGERAVESLSREIREETGLEPTVDGPVFTATKRRKKKRGKFLVYYRGRVAAADRGAVRLSEEHDEWAWLSPDAAAERLTRRRRRALERAVEAR
jgi:8-oxo-dGTP diphosphatase